MDTRQQSSCDCYNCKNNMYILEKQSPKNCNFSPYFECNNRLTFKNQNEPANKIGYEYLNPYATSKSLASDFYKVDCGKDPTMGNCSTTLYSSTDPRLISAAHNGQILSLDSPPIDESIKLSEVYTDPRLKYYGQKYNNYSDINAGQITYYVDKSIEDTLFQPLFENPSNVTGKIYKDPMSSVYPEYHRTPIKNNNVLKTKNRIYTNGLSWLDDSNETREDIMHLQMRQHDRSRYEPRWTGDVFY
jgi:hypothetical protein